MSEKVATARRALAALSKRDHEEVASTLDPDVAVRASGGLRTRRYKGVGALSEAYCEAEDHFDALSLSVNTIEEDEDGAVLMTGSVSVRERRDGNRVRIAVRGVLHFRDGLIHKVYLRRARRARS